ncbi:hypothetical protein LIER_23469 [Lithospermum erythrorhizon]|uniref:Uncharacterized protein n=1 Tax=Lithospermum erythrorhizon TaxID=34254 RepID=A0AAV3R102_LITER
MASRNPAPKFEELSRRNQTSADTLDNRHEATDLVDVNLNENAPIQSSPLDINIPPRSVKSSDSLQDAIRILQTPSANGVNDI